MVLRESQANLCPNSEKNTWINVLLKRN